MLGHRAPGRQAHAEGGDGGTGGGGDAPQQVAEHDDQRLVRERAVVQVADRGERRDHLHRQVAEADGERQKQQDGDTGERGPGAPDDAPPIVGRAVGPPGCNASGPADPAPPQPPQRAAARRVARRLLRHRSYPLPPKPILPERVER